MERWLLYGAYGYTGRLLAREALARSHRPILGGRNEGKLLRLKEELEEELGGELQIRTFALDDAGAMSAALSGVAAVLHAAGPFVETGRPMMEACLSAGVHYLDITGEVPVFELAFSLDGRARERGVVLMPGVGMDVIPTDAAAALVWTTLPGAVRLELALHSPGSPSSGTLQTILEGIPGGLLVRRNGKLQGANPGAREFRRTIHFGPGVESGPMAGKLGGERPVAPYTWGDLSTAWRTTGIGNITCYMVSPSWQVRVLPMALPLLRGLLSLGPLRRFLRRRVAGEGATGPDADRRRTGRTRVWGRAEDVDGGAAEVVLEFPEGYRFTALGGVRAVEAVLALEGAAGTLTPAGTFGADWVLALPGVEVVRKAGAVRDVSDSRDRSPT